ERFLHAVARRHRLDSLAGCYREAWWLQELDCLAGDSGVLMKFTRHVLSSLRRAHFSSRLRHRSKTWSFHSRISYHSHRRFTRALRMASKTGRPRIEIRTFIARIAAADEQRSANRGGRIGF